MSAIIAIVVVLVVAGAFLAWRKNKDTVKADVAAVETKVTNAVQNVKEQVTKL